MARSGFLYLLSAIVAFCIPMMGQGSPKVSGINLAGITERGISLAGYDAAARHASDAVMALHPREGLVARYIARKSSTGWIVAFGRLNTTKDRFLVAYEAIQVTGSANFQVQNYQKPREDVGFNLSSARAIETALKDFQKANRPYNVAVLPAKPDGLFVYVYPAQVKAGVYPFGADVRYRISPAGTRIITKRQLHKALIESVPANSPDMIAGGYHVHVLSEVPEDTDVLLVLTRQPRVPETVVTDKYAFTIDVNGKITVTDAPALGAH
jgi:hypothetical protein